MPGCESWLHVYSWPGARHAARSVRGQRLVVCWEMALTGEWTPVLSAGPVTPMVVAALGPWDQHASVLSGSFSRTSLRTPRLAHDYSLGPNTLHPAPPTPSRPLHLPRTPNLSRAQRQHQLADPQALRRALPLGASDLAATQHRGQVELDPWSGAAPLSNSERELSTPCRLALR